MSVGPEQSAIHHGIVDRSASTGSLYCADSAITSSSPVKSGGCIGLVKISDGATSSRIAVACIPAASANIVCMNDAGSSSWSIECAAIGAVVDAPAGDGATAGTAAANAIAYVSESTAYLSRT